MSEIKPCPFCGGEGHLRKQNRTILDKQTVRNCYVYCLSCDARGKRFLEGNTPEEYAEARRMAVESWNSRKGEKE